MWLPKTEYDRLVRQVESLQESLDIERAENRRSERWWARQVQLKAGRWPMPEENAPSPPAESFTSTAYDSAIDDGELEAMIEAGKQYGVPAEEVKSMLLREKGIET